MKQIRQAWETNSSSSHSLVLENTPGMPVDATHFGAVEDNILRVIFQETCFGWQWDVWDTPIEKLAYLILDGLDVERAERILTRNLNVKTTIIPELDNTNYNAYIDHQSIGTSWEVRNSSDEEIWQFLTNDSEILGGNDNEGGPWDTGEDY